MKGLHKDNYVRDITVEPRVSGEYTFEVLKILRIGSDGTKYLTTPGERIDSNSKQRLTVQFEQYAAMRQKRESAKSRLDEIYTILDGLKNHPMKYDDKLVRQIIECVVVESKEKIKVVFIGGTEIEMAL